MDEAAYYVRTDDSSEELVALIFEFRAPGTGKEAKNQLEIVMSKAHPPELKKFMEKRLSVKLNGNRTVVGLLRGFDPFMNLVLDDAIEKVSSKESNHIGMVVVRGNSIVMLEAVERI